MQFYQCITDFIFVEDEPEKADVIFVPGGSYPEAAIHAAELYRQGFAPYVLPSGKYSILKGRFEPDMLTAKKDGRSGRSGGRENHRDFQTECSYLSDILIRNGVAEEAVIREDQATFTWENAIFSRRRLQELNIPVKRAIISCQAFHARRCLMYYQEQFPETEILVSPVVTKGISRDTWYQTEQGIDTVLGEMERCGSQFHQIMRMHRNGQEDIDD